MFAIGDRVIINYPSSDIHGMIGTIIGHPDKDVYEVDVKILGVGCIYLCRESDLLLGNTFQIGQTVRLLNLMNAASIFNGRYGTITSKSEHLSNVWNITLDDGTFADLIPENCMQPVEEKLKTKIEMPHAIVTLQDAIKFEIESKKPKYEGQAAVWHREGKCPKCGELGYFSMSVAICKDHGEY